MQTNVWLNYLIAVIAYIAFYLLRKKGPHFLSASRFMLFCATAALLGGFVHHIENNMLISEKFFSHLNAFLPSFVEPISLEQFLVRLWFITMVSIGFSEYYFMTLFIYPVLTSDQMWIKKYLTGMLIAFIILTLISSQYLFVVAFHVVSHLICFFISMVFILKYKIYNFILVIFLLIYNISAGIMQQLMAKKVLPTGPLHYNDWYHIAMILFVIFLYLMFSKTTIIEKIHQKHT